MKYCDHCGKQIPDNSTFCPGCGQKVDSAPVPPKVTPGGPVAPGGFAGGADSGKRMLLLGSAVVSLIFMILPWLRINYLIDKMNIAPLTFVRFATFYIQWEDFDGVAVILLIIFIIGLVMTALHGATVFFAATSNKIARITGVIGGAIELVYGLFMVIFGSAMASSSYGMVSSTAVVYLAIVVSVLQVAASVIWNGN